MTKYIRVCLVCLVVVLLYGPVQQAQSTSEPISQEQINALEAEIRQLTVQRDTVTDELEKGREKQAEAFQAAANERAAAMDIAKIVAPAFGVAIVEAILFIIYIRRRQFFDKPMVVWVEGRKYIFAFEAFKADVRGTRRGHYKCPVSGCGEAALVKVSCRDHLLDQHQPELARYKTV